MYIQDKFQVHKGTIRTATDVRSDNCLSVFQFHKGTIRLLHLLLQLIPLIFQFHKGTIRTLISWNGAGTRQNFNSIKVRLELETVIRLIVPFPYFNSIKVRLEQKNGEKVTACGMRFQFHKGTIRTPWWVYGHGF